MLSSSVNDDRMHMPTAHETMELISEGQALKQRLREQYADQIEAALRETKLTLEGNKGGPNSVERYYYGKPVSASSPLLSSATNTTTINALSSLNLTTGAASPTRLNGDGRSSLNATALDTTVQSSLSPSKRDLLILQGYLPPTAAEVGSPLAPRASTTVETIRSTQRALADADERERRLKALIDQNDPIRFSLRNAQQKAIRSLIEATESSLAWEVRLTAEKADPKSPLYQNEETRNTPTKQNEENGASVNGNNGLENANEPRADSTTAAKVATGDQTATATSSPTIASASSASVIVNKLHTSPVRERGSYAEERAALEKRLGLLLKLEKEHEIVSKCEVATRNVYDGRRRFVEEAMDVTISREMAKAQEESRRARGAEAEEEGEGEGEGNIANGETSANPKQNRDDSSLCDDPVVAPTNERKLF